MKTALLRVIGLETKGEALNATDAKMARLWGRLFGYGDTAAGKAVTPDTALQVASFWACVKLLSETIATLPLTLYRREADGGRTAANDHPLAVLLRVTPDGEHTAVEFWEGAILSMCLTGDAFAEKVRAGDGRLIALQAMRADLTTVRRDRNGRLAYDYSDPLGARTLDEADAFHLRAFGGTGLRGLSPLHFARQTVSASIAADEVANKLFANGVRPSGVLKSGKTVLKPEQRKDLLENVVKPLAGSSNAGGVFVLEAGMEFSPISLSPADSQLLESRRWHVEEIARWFGIPPILIGHAAQGQTMWGTGVESIALSWLTLGLRAQLKRIEAAISLRLIEPTERAELYAEFAVEGLLRADSEGRAKLWSSLATNGIMDRDEIREKENLPRRGGGAAKLTVQAAMLPIDDLGKVAQLPREKPVEPGSALAAPEAKVAPGISLHFHLGSPEPRTIDLDEGKGFNPDQARDALGRWGAGAGAAISAGAARISALLPSSKPAAAPARESTADRHEREQYRRDVLNHIAFGAAVAGVGTVAALAGGPGLARVAILATSVIEQFVLGDAMRLAVQHAAHREGITPSNIRAKFDALLGRTGAKAAPSTASVSSGALKRIQADLVAALDEAADGIRAKVEDAVPTIGAEAATEGLDILAGVRADALAAIEALTDADLVSAARS